MYDASSTRKQKVNPFAWSWLAQSIASLLFVIPAWLSIAFFQKVYGVKGEVMMMWFFFGTSVGAAVIMRTFLVGSFLDLVPSGGVLLGILLVGLTFGASTNVLLFSATAVAPNQAIPPMIQNASQIFVFPLAILLGMYFPKLFPPAEMDPWRFVGIVLVLFGGIFMAFGRSIFTVFR